MKRLIMVFAVISGLYGIVSSAQPIKGPSKIDCGDGDTEVAVRVGNNGYYAEVTTSRAETEIFSGLHPEIFDNCPKGAKCFAGFQWLSGLASNRFKIQFHEISGSTALVTYKGNKVGSDRLTLTCRISGSLML